MKKLLTLLTFISVAAHAASTTYHVTTTGSDSNDGLTSGTGFARINYAISKCVAGDKVYIHAATPGGTTTYNQTMGTAFDPIGNPSFCRIPSGVEICAAPGDTIILAPDTSWNSEALYLGSYNQNPGAKTGVFIHDIQYDLINNANDVNVFAMSYLAGDPKSYGNILSNLVFRNSGGGHGALVVGNSNVFVNCISTNNGIRFYLRNNDNHAWYCSESIGNYFTNCWGGIQGSGASGTPHAFHCNATGGSGSVESNIFANCKAFGGPGASAGYPAGTNMQSRGFGVYKGKGNQVIGCEATNCIIGFYANYAATNTFFDWCTAKFCFYGFDAADSLSTVVWRNDLSVSNSGAGFRLESGCGPVAMTNCMSAQNPANLQDNSGGSLTQGGVNLIGNQYDPKFSSATSLTPTSTSSQRNAGIAIPSSPAQVDINGVTRGGAASENIPEIGSQDFTGGGTTPVYSITTTVSPTYQNGSTPDGVFTVTRDVTTSKNTNYFQLIGTATNGVHYTAVTTNLVFNIGVSSLTITIDPLASPVVTGNLTVICNLWPDTTYSLSSATNASIVYVGTNPARIGYQIHAR